MRQKARNQNAVTKILAEGEIYTRVTKCNDDLVMVDMHCTGKLAVFPSTSNNREIGFRNYKTRSQPFIRKSRSQIQRLTAAKVAYVSELLRSGIAIPSFKKEPVIVSVYLCSGKGIRDSHNYSKPIGDWLEDIGLIDNDKDAEIHCYKQSDYPNIFKNFDSTITIISVVARKHLQSTIEQSIINEIHKKGGLL